MEEVKVISGDTEDEIWQAVEADFANGEVFNYEAIIREGDTPVELYMDIDLGGGFESGAEITTLKAPLRLHSDFKFSVNDQGAMDSIGKFFGMQDVEVGYPVLDHHLVIKTNNKDKVRQIFTDANLRQLFTSLSGFDCSIHNCKAGDSDAEQTFLELNINEGINEPKPLRKVYHGFHTLVNAIHEVDKP